MDLEKLFTSTETREEKLDYDGVQVIIRVRDLGWSEKNQILSKCFTYHSEGSVSFDFDRYMKLSLEKMIVQAPWGETNHIFFNRIKREFGEMLEKLVPQPFEMSAKNKQEPLVAATGGKQGDFFAQK